MENRLPSNEISYYSFKEDEKKKKMCGGWLTIKIKTKKKKTGRTQGESLCRRVVNRSRDPDNHHLTFQSNSQSNDKTFNVS